MPHLDAQVLVGPASKYTLQRVSAHPEQALIARIHGRALVSSLAWLLLDCELLVGRDWLRACALGAWHTILMPAGFSP